MKLLGGEKHLQRANMGEKMTLVSVKLKILSFLFKIVIKSGNRLHAYRSELLAAGQIDQVTNQQKFDMRSMGDRVKNVLLHDQDIIDKRRAICDDCEFKMGLNCTKCGCFIKAKTRVATVGCPVGKWDKEHSFMEGKPSNGTQLIAE